MSHMKTDENMTDVEFKVIFCGNSRVGKSYLVAKMLGINPFLPRVYQGDSIHIRFFTLLSYRIKLVIFDVPAKVLQKANENVQKDFFTKTSGAFFLFDSTSQESIESLPWWNEKLLKYNSKTELEKILVATKADLMENEIILPKKITEMGKKLATKNIIITSAKTGLNVELTRNAMIYSLIKDIIKKSK